MSRVLLVDGHPIFRRGLRQVLEEARIGEVCEADGIVQAKALLANASDVALIVVDVGPANCNDLADLSDLKSHFESAPIVAVVPPSGKCDDRTIAAGATAILPRAATCPDVLRVLRDTLEDQDVGQGEPRSAVRENPLDSLSPAQRRILDGLLRGLRNKQIAFEMGITEKTVKAYTTAMYRKLGVSSRTQAIILAGEVMGPDNSH